MPAGSYSDNESAMSPASSWAAVTASDSTSYQPKPKALYIGGAGTIVAKGADGVSATFTCIAGQTLPIRPQHVMAASTATGVIALY